MGPRSGSHERKCTFAETEVSRAIRIPYSSISTLVPNHTFGQPPPQSGGRRAAMFSGRLVRIWYVRCGVSRMIFHASGLHISASSMKKSDREQVNTYLGSFHLLGAKNVPSAARRTTENFRPMRFSTHASA